MDFPYNMKSGAEILTVGETSSAHCSGLGEILTSRQRRQGGKIDSELAKRWNGQNKLTRCERALLLYAKSCSVPTEILLFKGIQSSS